MMQVIQYPHAHECMLQAHAIIAAAYPAITELVVVEEIGCDGMFINVDSKQIVYDPQYTYGVSLTDLVDALHNGFVNYYLMTLPRCTLATVYEDTLH